MAEALASMEAKVAALRQPCAYPGAPASVEVIETHMSWVFLTPDHVYKLKKPMRYDGLDLAGLDARRFYCLEELRLNRRLAPAVYVDAVALRSDGGALHIGGEGAVVDWLVWMRRLAADLMLDRLIDRGLATSAHMQRIAQRLADFHGRLPPALRDERRFRAHLRAQVDRCERELTDPAYALPAGEVRQVCGCLRQRLRKDAALFDARVRAGRVVEGHGDLRPEHVWLGEPLAIIDCLEFSATLRTLDVADEVAFLALECERLQAPQLGRELLAAWSLACGETPAPALMGFYQAFRACIRATIAIRHLKEERYRAAPKWPLRARQYLALAALHLQAERSG